MIENQYAPDTVSPPGDTLAETLEELGMSQADLALRMGRPQKTICEIINGKTAITPATALQLERVLGVSARFWLKREQHYQEWCARRQEEEQLRAEQDWLAQLPVQEMVQRGWIAAFADPIDQIRALLSYFGVASPAQWRQVWLEPKVAFRHTRAFTSDVGASAAWLRRGQLDAQAVSSAPYDAAEFKRALRQVRGLTVKPANQILPAVQDACAAAGVAVVVVPALAKSRARGATMWLSPTKAMVLFSLRYGKDDQFWFSFFHEAGHIVLHGKRDVFLEESDEDSENLEPADADATQEQEADAYAADLLVPRHELRRFALAHKPYFSKDKIRAFAREQGIAPGIVVGRLQHEGHMSYTHCNDLKATIDWSAIGAR